MISSSISQPFFPNGTRQLTDISVLLIPRKTSNNLPQRRELTVEMSDKSDPTNPSVSGANESEIPISQPAGTMSDNSESGIPETSSTSQPATAVSGPAGTISNNSLVNVPAAATRTSSRFIDLPAEVALNIVNWVLQPQVVRIIVREKEGVITIDSNVPRASPAIFQANRMWRAEYLRRFTLRFVIPTQNIFFHYEQDTLYLHGPSIQSNLLSLEASTVRLLWLIAGIDRPRIQFLAVANEIMY